MKKIIIIFFIILIIVIGVFWFVENYNKLELTLQNTNWTITQYGNNTGEQMMCYTVEGNVDGLIIIDGGYENDEKMIQKLKNIIKKHDNKVDVWILTHYDVDHAGAYMTIRNEVQDLQVEKILVQETPSLEICKENASWQTDWDLYERYQNLDIKEKRVVHAGDEFEDIIGLKLKVLCSYDNWVNEKTHNILNNGSIVFKLYSNNESMLFCSDVQVTEIETFLIENYKEDLKSDYLQVPHHGNVWFSEEFYKLVNPKIVFFDAPESIMKNYNNISWFTTEKLYNMFEEMGVQIYYFKDSPVSIIMN